MMFDVFLYTTLLLTANFVYMGYILACVDHIKGDYWLVAALWPVALGLFTILYIS